MNDTTFVHDCRMQKAWPQNKSIILDKMVMKEVTGDHDPTGSGLESCLWTNKCNRQYQAQYRYFFKNTFIS